MKSLGFYHQIKLSHQLFCIFQKHKITYAQLFIAALFVVTDWRDPRARPYECVSRLVRPPSRCVQSRKGWDSEGTAQLTWRGHEHTVE